ncbi:MAG: GTPase ObgE [Gemmatimonadetes bacterium]|nr:GTPase ObgE [Gemmatimonadota bacterium]MBT8402487.1 GTPase ObgE [Gemmatimonadota bacterium]NNK63012.1 GTPase ObgE [Gemmatimonadota bacterium]
MFVDRAVIELTAGTGGSGAESFRRESGVPRGGPNGGDGGKGGDVILVADKQLTTLLDYSYRRHYKADRGQHGMGSNKTGKGGDDRVLRVPPGTLVRDLDSGELLGELLGDGDRLVAARGGRGGRGNARFATATHQAPRRWEPGEEGEQRMVELELKLIADVGLVGEPNAGKSTFLATVSRARPKVADYPFTTLKPNLGVVELPDFRSFVLADIPGIIEGAHEGKGLGHQFLRHVERTRTLALMVPLDSPDADAEYRRLRSELQNYAPELAAKPHCLVFTKADLLGPDDAPPEVVAPEAWGRFVVSAVTRRGVPELLEALWAKARERRELDAEEADSEW